MARRLSEFFEEQAELLGPEATGEPEGWRERRRQRAAERHRVGAAYA
jgi:hypothetical protein